MIKAILFDLDGTLLPMDQDVFIGAYFKGLAKKLAPLGYKPEELVSAIWSGTAAMIKNDGKASNETVFWNEFEKLYGKNARKDEPYFEEFYRTDFQKVKEVCGFNAEAKRLVDKLNGMGLKVVLATNPIFPRIATKSRIGWAGLSEEDFCFYTTYENISCSKPGLRYYFDIAARIGVLPEECVMVGNDVEDDMAAEAAGMKVFLLTDCLINKAEKDISQYPNGDFSALNEYLSALVK